MKKNNIKVLILLFFVLFLIIVIYSFINTKKNNINNSVKNIVIDNNDVKDEFENILNSMNRRSTRTQYI